MEPKCNYCSFFGDKPHCHNCKIINKSRAHTPQEIDCSLEELVEYINQNADISERFGVGDYKTIELYTGEKVKLIILDMDKDTLAEGNGEARVTFGILKMDGSFEMNTQNTNEGGWGGSKMRKDYMDRFFRILPEVLRNNIKPVLKKTSAGYRSSEIVYSTDKVFLFSEIEVFGKTRYSYSGEGEQYEFFSFAQNISFDRYTWLRSPYCNYSSYFCYVSSSGEANCSGAGYTRGVALGFCI